MKNEELKQDYFISSDDHINIRLKVITDDKVEREKLVSQLMGQLYRRDEGFELSKHATIDQLYFQDQNPLTALEDSKKKLISDIENMFNALIERESR